MKKNLLLIAFALLGLTAASCKKEKGCTTSSATNFSSSAEEDDASCTYKGSVAFWVMTGTLGGATINVYINNVFQGNIAVTFSSAPSCGGTGVLTINKDLGKNKTQSYSVTYKNVIGGVEDTDPADWTNENVIFEATCTSHRAF